MESRWKVYTQPKETNLPKFFVQTKPSPTICFETSLQRTFSITASRGIHEPSLLQPAATPSTKGICRWDIHSYLINAFTLALVCTLPKWFYLLCTTFFCVCPNIASRV